MGVIGKRDPLVRVKAGGDGYGVSGMRRCCRGGGHLRLDECVVRYYTLPMAYLSIRNLPEHLERRITQEARRRHTTKTAIVLEYLERGARAARLPADRPTLRSWSGKLSSRDLARVLRASRAHRVIDDELWSE